MPRVIAIALYHRQHLLRGRYRQLFRHEACRWGIVASPEGSQEPDCQTYVATDRSECDKTTWRIKNPSMDWYLCVNDKVEPKLNSSLVGQVVIGNIPDGVADAQLEAVLGSVPLLVKNAEPQQSDVTWTSNAVRALRKHKWVEDST